MPADSNEDEQPQDDETKDDPMRGNGSAAAAAVADQWSFAQCEEAYSRVGVAGKLLDAKTLCKSATYTTKEVFDDWKAHG